MHRLRKKSDSVRASTSPALHNNTFPPPAEDKRLPGLPSANAFRTSLILPELTRRFTLLRTSSGDPVSLVDLKLKFAEQRERGALNQISEAEEEMILQTLGRIRSKHPASTTRPNQTDAAASSASEAGMDSDYTPERSSHISSNTASTTYPASSVTSSPRSTKRYSNNLFSSGRLRDYGYLRTISQKAHRSAVSIAHTESSQSLREETSLNSIDSLRPPTPDGGGHASPPSSPNDKTPIARTASLVSSNEDLPPQSSGESGSGIRLSKRASAALAQVIKEFEEEVEDEIVMPRTIPPVPRPSDSDHSRVVSDAKVPSEPGASFIHHRLSSDYEAGTAISSDGQIIVESDARQLSPTPYGRPGTVSPTPRLPGYIPGMPRPMTPRDSSFDTEDIRSHSTTPRASSPIPIANGQSAHKPTSSISSSLFRRGSDASRSTPRPTSPQTQATISPYLSRSNSGRRTPDTQRDSTSGTEQEGTVTSSAFIRRRPVSPLSGPAFQPMAVSPRPSTPSNITWTVGASASPEKTRVKSESRSTHSRSGSQSTETDFQINAERSKSPTGSTRSPVPPESPGPTQTSFTSKWNNSVSPPDSRAPSSLSTYEFGSTLSFGSRGLRSPTPTQTYNAASPTFPSDSNSNAARPTKHHFKSSSNYSYGFSQLSLCPIANSSRSSLESTGSSYHSWERNQKIGGALDVFNGSVGQTLPAWCGLDKSDSLIPGSSQDECDFESIIRRYAGLTKSDFVAIQEKLVGAAFHKAALPDTRERSNSLRRRRPSTSQSNYSTNGRVMSPTPTQIGPAGRRSPALDNNAKANALLESVVDSIPITQIDTKVEDTVQPEISPTTRRTRDLARALGLGNDDSDHLVVPQMSDQDSSSISVSPTVEAILPLEFLPEVENDAPVSTQRMPSETTLSPGPPPQRSQSMRNPPSAPIDQTDLAREVQRKADAATAALMKSSGKKFSDVNVSSVSVSRKKIDPSQISEPRLLSAPTSVETIPLPALTSPPPLNPQASLGITQRMRRLRNTLRVKPTAQSGEEVSSHPVDIQPQPAPTSHGLNRRPTLPLSRFGPSSSTELAKIKTPNSSPPASAGPGFKGLMARFRKPRTMDGAGDSQSSVHSRTSPTTSSPTASSHQGHARGNATTSGHLTATTVPPSEASAGPSVDASAALANDVDSAAVKQLFEAASKIGLDQVALNDLLTRSTSVSRAAGWAWPGGSSSAVGNMLLTPGTQPGLDRSHPPPPADKHPSDDDQPSSTDDKTVRELPVQKAGEHGQVRQNHQTPENAAVIRRTLIFPSEFRSSKVDLNQPNRKAMARRHRRSGSATSAQSARSVHDRAPTPPPPKANGGRRFSTERSPPVPGAATSIGAQAEVLLRAPSSNATAEKPSSAYDSLYDMYSGESKHASAVIENTGTERGVDNTAIQEGPAVEVIEMANGETIWQIVNGLRDDEIDSLYPSRTSVGSDHSTRENGDGVQLFVKEHARSTSKSGGSSITSRKRSSQSKYRPETKVFYSSSAQIGRLIESLSQGMDAGSFNFILPQSPEHSTANSLHSDGDTQWTVEERLEHMLGAIGNT